MSIVKELRKDGISTTHHTCRICKWTKGGGLQDQARPGWPSVIAEEIAEYLDKMLEDDDELSVSEILSLIAKKLRVQISALAIRQFLRLKLNWVTVRSISSPMISDANKIKCVEFCQTMYCCKGLLQRLVWHARSVRIEI